MTASAENDGRRVGTIWMLDLDGPAAVVTPRLQATFRQAGTDLAPALAAMVEGAPSAGLLQRFESGRQCYTAWVEEQLAAYGWVSFNDERIGELNLRLRLMPGEAYIWDCATALHFRGHHLYSALLVYILEELRAQGLRRAWIGADLDNVASQKGMARAGFHHVADLLIGRSAAQRRLWVEGLHGVPDILVAEAHRAFLGNRRKAGLAVSGSAPPG